MTEKERQELLAYRKTLPCICEGNIRAIIDEIDPFLGKKCWYNRVPYKFIGMLYSDDGLYYGLWNENTNSYQWLSCVGSLKTWGVKFTRGRV